MTYLVALSIAHLSIVGKHLIHMEEMHGILHVNVAVLILNSDQYTVKKG